MTFFRQLQGSPIAWIFTLISLVYFVNGLRLGRTVWQNRQKFSEGALQPWKKQWAERAAFLLAVPPGVFIHELFHALPVWAFGGQVVDVGYGFYWGYVAPVGVFSNAQDWFISLAGTLGTLLYGFGVWLFLRRRDSSAWRYFGLRTLRFHLYYGLLYYPLFTLFTFIGDWRTIYDFEATPGLSSVTLAVHVGSLALFWWTDRRGWFEMPAFESSVEEEQLENLRGQAAQNPDDEQAQLQLVEYLRQRGATAEARDHLQRFLRRHPRSAEGHLIMAFLETDGRERVSRRARNQAQEALQLGLQEAAKAAAAHTLLAQYLLQVEKWDEALQHLDQALGTGVKLPVLNRAQLHYLRAMAQRRRGRYNEADQEIAQAISLAESGGHQQLAERYRNEQQVIAHHRGR